MLCCAVISLARRRGCLLTDPARRRALQFQLGLNERPEAPLIAFIGRLAPQKVRPRPKRMRLPALSAAPGFVRGGGLAGLACGCELLK